MATIKPEYDWGGLRKEVEKHYGENRLKSITVTLPQRDPPRVMSNATAGIYPVLSSAADYYDKKVKRGRNE